MRRSARLNSDQEVMAPSQDPSSAHEQNSSAPKQAQPFGSMVDSTMMANFMNVMAMFQKSAMKAESEPETKVKPVQNPKELTVVQLKQNDWSFSVGPESILSSDETWHTWYDDLVSSLEDIDLTPSDVDDLPPATRRRIIRDVRSTISQRLRQHVVGYKSFTPLIDQLRSLTIGDTERPEAEVEIELCALEFRTGEILAEFLDRYQLLLARACAIGLELSDRMKMSFMIAAIERHYGALSLQMRSMHKFSNAFGLLRAEAKSQRYKRPPVPLPSTKAAETSSGRRGPGCWNCGVTGHHSNKCPEKTTLLPTAAQTKVSPLYRQAKSKNHTAAQFLKALDAIFLDPHAEERAEAELLRLSQGNNEPFSVFMPKFENLLLEAGIVGDRACISILKRCLNDELVKAVCTGVKAKTYPAFVSEVFGLASDLEALRGRQTRMNTLPRSSHWTPASAPPTQAAPSPDRMDWQSSNVPLKPITPGERESLKQTNSCFRCRKPGHLRRNCPLNQGQPVVTRAIEAQQPDNAPVPTEHPENC
ncbi:hypothetical protein CFIMG_008222RA00001 [Ceratocystis fimbriata CBS 114723]|uniref:CCHC-type domain-containing protein n=1 Tax=Ceratocystis fimbriata CBS 114723 TaxID=1035309 RepID=A0A2C5X5I9_9PEZI|nr:hypothetical protein CFIMG_008222RA00001 [Ceratocystis fimbriata CBS 114723]